MTSRTKLSRNDACPCGSGDKYKRCCKGKVAWEDLLAQPLSDQLPHITARGRNIMFIEHLAEPLCGVTDPLQQIASTPLFVGRARNGRVLEE